MHHEGNRRLSVGEQALFLVEVADRLTALRRTTAAMQVALARAIVLHALASIAVRYVFTSALQFLFRLLSRTENEVEIIYIIKGDMFVCLS